MQSIMRMLLSIMMQGSVRTEDYSDSVAHVYMYVLGHDVMSYKSQFKLHYYFINNFWPERCKSFYICT